MFFTWRENDKFDPKNWGYMPERAESGPSFLRVLFPDHLGRLRSLQVRWDGGDLPSPGFDGSSIPWFAKIERSDMTLIPDPETLRSPPGIVFANSAGPEGPFESDPRLILGKVVKKAKEMGFEPVLGVEPEFFLVRDDGEGKRIRPADRGGYFSVPPREASAVIERAAAAIEEAGGRPVKYHHEVAPGQYELVIEGGDPVRTCDLVSLMREEMRLSAADLGLRATFMPKPFSGINGSGMHMHLSLRDASSGEAVMGRGRELSPVGSAFLAGLLRRAREITAVAAPTVNSYKRLVPGHEAPVYVSWGRSNRSALVRVPFYGGKVSRIEFRAPDASCNPYLVAAVSLAAGLEGIELGLEPPEESGFNVYEGGGEMETLPPNLAEAARELRSSQLARSVLGEGLVEEMAARQEAEWRAYLESAGGWEETLGKITDWELERYL